MSDLDVEIRGVVKRFGSFTAVNGIDLLVRRGTFITLLGPSGCGKTTTLRMIGGLELPDEGTISVAGSPLIASGGADRPTRMVFQNYALFPHMTVAENVAFGLRMQKVADGEIDSRVGAIVELLGLTTHIGKYPRQMSGGQQQRVALARGLVTRPRVLLLDEPLGALDLKMRKHMQGELKKLQREVGITFVYVTHDQDEAMHLSDAIVVMDHGRIVQQGTAAEIYQNPATPYVADFIGEANLLPGIYAASTDGDAALTPDLGALPGERADNFDPAPGSPVLFSIRPEHVHTGDEAVAQPYHLTGTVTGVSYLGAASLLTVSAGGTSLRANVPGVFTGEIGQRIEFGWSPLHGRILPHDDRFAAGVSA